MNKLFRPKCLRRVLLCLALLFPIVYLCGGLFFALAGAHGEQLFAEPVYVEDYAQVDDFTGDGKYKLEINSALYPTKFNTGSTITFDFTYNNQPYEAFRIPSVNTVLRFLTDSEDVYSFVTVIDENTTDFPIVIYFENEVNRIILNEYATLYKAVLVPSEIVPENNSAYTDFIFSQPFAKDNFITTLGKDLVNGSTKGFNPMNELFRSINTNVMHFDGSDNLAMFGLGYVYYAVNVLIVYEVLILAVKLIMLPLRVVELFDKKEDI